MSIPSYSAGILQVRAYRLLQAAVSALLEPFDLTPSEWCMLGLIHEHPHGVRLSMLAEILGVEAPLVTMMADTLVRKAYIARASHPSDGRAKILILTDNGRRLVPQIERAVSSGLMRLIDGIPAADMQAYYRVLQTIIKQSRTDKPELTD